MVLYESLEHYNHNIVNNKAQCKQANLTIILQSTMFERGKVEVNIIQFRNKQHNTYWHECEMLRNGKKTKYCLTLKRVSMHNTQVTQHSSHLQPEQLDIFVI